MYRSYTLFLKNSLRRRVEDGKGLISGDGTVYVRRFSLIEPHQRQLNVHGVVSSEDMGVVRARRISVGSLRPPFGRVSRLHHHPECVAAGGVPAIACCIWSVRHNPSINQLICLYSSDQQAPPCRPVASTPAKVLEVVIRCGNAKDINRAITIIIQLYSPERQHTHQHSKLTTIIAVAETYRLSYLHSEWS